MDKLQGIFYSLQFNELMQKQYIKKAPPQVLFSTPVIDKQSRLYHLAKNRDISERLCSTKFVLGHRVRTIKIWKKYVYHCRAINDQTMTYFFWKL